MRLPKRISLLVNLPTRGQRKVMDYIKKGRSAKKKRLRMGRAVTGGEKVMRTPAAQGHIYIKQGGQEKKVEKGRTGTL